MPLPATRGITHSHIVNLLDRLKGEFYFLTLTAESPSDRLVLPLGEIPGIKRFTCCHRYEPFWNTAKAGLSVSEIPPETQYLLCELEDQTYLLVVPLVDGAMRCSIQGNAENVLEMVAESGDPSLTANEVCGVYLAVGGEPFLLVSDSAERVCDHLKTGRLRRDKPLPDFVESFGWCTWDAFYFDVSEKNIREGLKQFHKGGVQPKYLIIDDGWLSTEEQPDKSKQLTSFDADKAKFPTDLRGAVSVAKREFGVESVLAWHAVVGYWGGTSPALGYESQSVTRKLSPGILAHTKEMPWWGDSVAVVPTTQVHRFYQDFHRHLRLQGIDGVKIDSQAALELVSEGVGGRVKLMQTSHEAMEGSAQVHFDGALINCMSCANDMMYATLASSLTRTSTDFWPNRPESHGLHLYVNAQVGVWFGEFIHPDWDMFQSAHPAGTFHAAARAVSGSPVYVSDKPGTHDFDLLKKLIATDGDIYRCPNPGRPTLDCLFADPTREEVLLKIWNTNIAGGVVGAFNAYYSQDGGKVIRGTLSPSDIPAFDGGTYAIYAHNQTTLFALEVDEAVDVSLPPLGWEIYTIVSVEEGFAPIGYVDKLNGGGAITFAATTQDGVVIAVTGGGEFLALCDWEPSNVLINGEPVEFEWDQELVSLRFNAPADTVEIQVLG